jgi:methionyl-tRNA formyltransferase
MISDTRTLYVSCAANGLYGLEYLLDAGMNCSGVITISPEVAAKNNVSGYADFRPFCEVRNLPLVVLDGYKLTPDYLPADPGDVLIVNGWNRLIPGEVFDRFPYGGLGIHAGHPPIGLGRAPLPWNIIKGHPDIEVYVFQLTENADDGDILALRPVQITPQDTVQLLYEKVMHTGAELFVAALDRLPDKSGRIRQDKSQAELYPKRAPEDGLIDFRQPVEVVYNFIRAQSSPYPGAFAELDGERWTIDSAVPYDTHAFRGTARVPGAILAALPSGLVVQTGSSPIWLLSATVDGKVRLPCDCADARGWMGRRFNAEKNSITKS